MITGTLCFLLMRSKNKGKKGSIIFGLNLARLFNCRTSDEAGTRDLSTGISQTVGETKSSIRRTVESRGGVIRVRARAA